ncbi:MAG: thioredoxin family protein, partial [Myxococcota bacterium]|nr:thioredoxin family protein [Myxococcota bacterium]
MKHDNLSHAVPLLFLVMLCLSCSSSQNNWPSVKVSDLPVEEMMTEWRTDVETALSEATQAGQPILIYWGATWCQP